MRKPSICKYDSKHGECVRKIYAIVAENQFLARIVSAVPSTRRAERTGVIMMLLRMGRRLLIGICRLVRIVHTRDQDDGRRVYLSQNETRTDKTPCH